MTIPTVQNDSCSIRFVELSAGPVTAEDRSLEKRFEPSFGAWDFVVPLCNLLTSREVSVEHSWSSDP